MFKAMKKLLPSSLKLKVIEFLGWFNITLIRLFSWSGFLASFYYTFLARDFYREHKSVLQGRLAYRQALYRIERSSILLRRNIHRIEKALIMRPRRNVFALDYIAETVECFVHASNSEFFCIEEKKWANDVLIEYFNVVDHGNALIKNTYERFSAAMLSAQSDDRSIPYSYRSLKDPEITFEKLVALFGKRRSVRWFCPKEVPQDKLRQVINAASLAPSACNRQPYSFHVISSPKKAVEIAKCAMGTAGFAENIPCIIAVVGDLSSYPYERDRHVIYIDGALASMQLMLALETVGLSSCPINWPDIELREKMLDASLGLKPWQRTVMLIAVGYADPDGGIPFSQKKPDSVLVKDSTHAD